MNKTKLKNNFELPLLTLDARLWEVPGDVLFATTHPPEKIFPKRHVFVGVVLL